jgi:5,10-methylenetetrahydrofolate reductase
MPLACPKHMEYGPCGGVEFDGTCEVASHPCVFLGTPTVAWHGLVDASREPDASAHIAAADPLPTPTVSSGSMKMRELLATRPVVVADFPATALSWPSIAECAAVLVGSVDAVLAGDAGAARVQFPPAYRAHLIQSAGLAVWTGLNCRDRNRVAIEGELAALAHVGVAGIHSVTGDHTLVGSRPDAAPVFDLDSTELAALASRAGLLVSVAEAPAAPPVDRRPARLLEKERAGAEICFVNHAGGVGPVRAFIEAAQALGSTMGFIPCVPIVIDRGSAELLQSFTTLVLPPGYLEGILNADGPDSVFEAGVAAAVSLGRGFLDIDGVVGVNLSGGAGPGQALKFARALARIGRELRNNLTYGARS